MTVTVYRVYIVAFVASLFAAHYVVGEQPSSNWKQHVINHLSPFEAAGVADFNQDGKLDVFSGDSWYAAPNWEAFRIREVPKGTNPHYYEDFADAPLDVNGDGHIDIVTCAYFSKKIAWLEHPGDPTKKWTEHQPHSIQNNETR